MKLFFLLFLLTQLPESGRTQSTVTVSKTCGKCHKSVSNSSKIGDICPHCKVRWGYENTTNTSNQATAKYTLNEGKTSDGNNSNINNQSTQKNESNPFSSYNKLTMETWILDKLRNYSRNYTYSSNLHGVSTSNNYSDFEFKFQDEYFIISYYYENREDRITYVPVKDISSIFGSSYGNNFSIQTSSNSMYEINLNTNNKFTKSYVSVGFQNNAEPELVQKMEMALLHLKNFYSMPKSNYLPEYTPKRFSNRPSVNQTKDWIIQKLNAYTRTKSLSIAGTTWFYKAFNFTFDNSNNLIVRYKEEVNNSVYNYHVTIPICDVTINRIKSTDFLSTRSENFSFYSKNGRIQDNNEHYGNKKITLLELSIDEKAEDNLIDRLIKAFSNLKSYCETKTTKELF